MKFKLLFFFLFSSISLFAQTDSISDEEIKVKQVVLDIFDAMRETDSIKLKNCFMDNVDVYTAFKHPIKGNQMKPGNIQDFITSVGTPHEGLYDERLGDYEIHVDGPLASMAVDYFFFVNDNFSHCGVDYFQFFKTSEGWKIFFLADTRRKSNCELPETTW